MTFANQTGQYQSIDIPVLWIRAMPAIRSLPLYGVGTADVWYGAPIDRATATPPMPQCHAQRERHVVPA